MATSLARGGLLAARRRLALAAPASSAASAAMSSSCDGRALPLPLAGGAALAPYHSLRACHGMISTTTTTTTTTWSLFPRRAVSGISARSFSAATDDSREKKKKLTQAEVAALAAVYDEDYDYDDDGGPLLPGGGGGRRRSSNLSPIGEDFSKMTNEELADTSTIPGWDLIHCPPRKKVKGALVGKVVSDKMAKTVNVAVDRYRIVPKYRKRRKYTKKFMAHDEKEVCNLGDVVMIVPCQRISKNKHFMVREIIRAKGTL